MVDGNAFTDIPSGEEIPVIAQEYALKNGYADKALSAPLNKAKSAPINKGKAK